VRRGVDEIIIKIISSSLAGRRKLRLAKPAFSNSEILLVIGDRMSFTIQIIMKRILTGVLAVAMAATFVAPAMAGAATVADIAAQIAALQAQLASLTGGSSSMTFTVNLTVGSKGADVSALQSWLVSKGFLTMPAGVAMGYFGNLTKSAVAAWQASAGISPAVGFFGPISRAKVDGMVVTVPGTPGTTVNCPTGWTCTNNSNTSGGTVSTPGVEGILTVSAGPISNTVVNVGQKMVPVLTIRNQAQTSDIAIQRVQLDLGGSTNIFHKIYNKLYVVDAATGNVLASTDLNSTTVVQSGSVYLVTISGFSFVVPKGTYKDLVIKADLYGSISSTYTSPTVASYTISVDANGVRGTDGAGIDQYGPASVISQAITVNSSLVDNSIANLSLDSSTPQANSIPVTDTTNGQYLKLPVLVFSLGAQNDGIHIHDLKVSVVTSGTGSATAAYLYQGSTQIASASISGSNALFTNIQDGTAGATVPVNTTLPYSIKVDVTGVTSASLAVTASTSNSFSGAGTTLYNSDDATVATFNGSATGNTQTVLGKGPAYTLNSSPSIAVSGSNQSGTTNSTSTITATFSVSVQAVGTAVTFGTQASTSAATMFRFKVFNAAGTDVSASVVSTSSGFIVPSGTGFITTGLGTNSFQLGQQQSGTLSGITFSFAGKDSTGTVLTAGPYSVNLSSITASNDTGTTQATQTYMSGLTSWRTIGVNP
jgi:hypothetical protein